MKFLKMVLYTGAGALGTWAHLNGHDVLMNIVFVVWLPFAAADLAHVLSPWDESFFGPEAKEKDANGGNR